MENSNSSCACRKIRRGQVYTCDLRPAIGSEQGGIRPAIIVQNDVGNLYSPTTIVLPLTARNKASHLPVHYTFSFSEENMIDYDISCVTSKKNVLLAE